MSKLKAYSYIQLIGYTPREKMAFYLKSEVDRHISELIADQQLELDEWYCRVEHNKYKRCLAMAEWCHEAWANISTTYQKAMWYRKWYEYWRELAEKFKEAK